MQLNPDDSNPDVGLLLGVVDRGDENWAAEYFPPDLPKDWHLAYIANDCDCVMLPASRWNTDVSTTDFEGLREALEEAPASLTLFLELPPGQVPPPSLYELFDGHRPSLLVEAPMELPVDWPQWSAAGADRWRNTSGKFIERWVVDMVDLRDWRARAEGLDPEVFALLLDGKGASPAGIPDLRTLLQLMGIA